MTAVTQRLRKLMAILKSGSPIWFRALKSGVAAGVEHRPILDSLNCETIIDIGANRGQFALVARRCKPNASIISFEPLDQPAQVFSKIFRTDDLTKLHLAAIGPESGTCTMHVSAKDDSSSLLPISTLQNDIFPGTAEVDMTVVHMDRLDSFITAADLRNSALLKIDVQGFELDVLRGSESLLSSFDYIYCECSYQELYVGQSLAADVVGWLSSRKFEICGTYNTSFDSNGLAVQSDMLFRRAP